MPKNSETFIKHLAQLLEIDTDDENIIYARIHELTTRTKPSSEKYICSSCEKEVSPFDDDHYMYCKGKPSSEISEDKFFQYISTLKSCFKNPNHYSLTEQTKIVEQDAVTLKKLIDEGGRK